MSGAELEALRGQLSAFDADMIDEPRMPIAVALQEANDLAILLAEDASVAAQLEAVGLDRAVIDGLRPAVGATREAQSRWVVLRDRSKPAAQKEREARGEALRSELLSAARWSLREDEVALGTLSAISEGDGLADLVQDLRDLAQLVERSRAAFAADRTFEAAASIEQARSLSDEISAGAGTAKLDGEAASARELRDRAYTHLATLVEQLRAAGRHAYRKDDRMRKRFVSRHLVRRRRAAAARKAQAPLAGS